VASLLPQSTVFLNNKEFKQIGFFQNGAFLSDLKAGKYFVAVSKEGYWPWGKNLSIKEQIVTETAAVLIPRELKNEIVFRGGQQADKSGGDNSDYLKYKQIAQDLKTLAKLIEKGTPADKNKIVSSNAASSTTKAQADENNPFVKFASGKKEKLWWDKKENKLWIEWTGDESLLPSFFCDDYSCGKKILVFRPQSPIRNADFYPDRRDLIIVAVQNGIYAIEIDGRGGRLPIPIYKGKNPIFKLDKDNQTLYILELDDNLLIKTQLE